jgi:hypothetical protein
VVAVVVVVALGQVQVVQVGAVLVQQVRQVAQEQKTRAVAVVVRKP